MITINLFKKLIFTSLFLLSLIIQGELITILKNLLAYGKLSIFYFTGFLSLYPILIGIFLYLTIREMNFLKFNVRYDKKIIALLILLFYLTIVPLLYYTSISKYLPFGLFLTQYYQITNLSGIIFGFLIFALLTNSNKSK
ncbi:hypothetical protein cpu_25620 [Carboxydothermus pertinax]|uniref:Uncharacterized protein n=1 Tax=Carboxydothermus pertinax TaxID=870242 RepID=A0A1L8CYP3_9THEO|nr:hypothetical protein cpu_25620 [Carboxydothermus pertinax]